MELTWAVWVAEAEEKVDCTSREREWAAFRRLLNMAGADGIRKTKRRSSSTGFGGVVRTPCMLWHMLQCR